MSSPDQTTTLNLMCPQSHSCPFQLSSITPTSSPAASPSRLAATPLKNEEQQCSILTRPQPSKKPDPLPQTGFRIDQFQGALVIVDPLSTGAVLANEAYCRGIPIICVFAAIYPPNIQQMCPKGYKHEFIATVYHEGNHSNVKAVADAIRNLKIPIRGVLAGCETGVEVAEALAFELGCMSNDPRHSDWRRNKHLMQQRISECGLRSIKETQAKEWDQVERFVESFCFDEQNPFNLIIKPSQSAGSDGVFLCSSIEELREKFDLLLSSKNILGQPNEYVVVQEYLRGKEYIVDCVSYHSIHKVTGIWLYDKRFKNNKPFVYYGIRLLPSDDELGLTLSSYNRKVLDALGIIHGASHAEIIMTSDGPCLVEVGARCQGGDGSFVDVIRPCQGYDQLSAAIDIYDQPGLFKKIPMQSQLNGSRGAELYFVSSVSGKWTGLRHIEKIEKLPSFVAIEWYLDLGSHIDFTTNCAEIPGACKMIHSSAEQLEKDIEEFHKWNDDGVFIVSTEPVADKIQSDKHKSIVAQSRERK